MSIILNQAGVLDSIVYYISIPLSHLSSAMAAVGMFIANAFINVFIGSGSGQTVVAMPIDVYKRQPIRMCTGLRRSSPYRP